MSVNLKCVIMCALGYELGHYRKEVCMKLKKILLVLSVGVVLSLPAVGCGGNTALTESEEKGALQADTSENTDVVGTDTVAEADVDEALGNESVAEESGASDNKEAKPLMEAIDGTVFTEADFAAYDLTLVNVFATWCGPCVKEIPELEKLSQEMKAEGVNVVGIVVDSLQTLDASGNEVYSDRAIETAKKLQEATGSTYLYLKPRAQLFDGRLLNVSAVPETFFVDKNGNVVGETYVGSRSFEQWSEIVKKELEAVKDS